MARFFNALVVAGAGLSISGCGGRAASDGAAGSSGASAGTGGTGGTGGTPSGGTGGTPSGGTGGTPSGGTGGTPSGGTGGTPSGGTGGAVPFNGLVQVMLPQWDCTNSFGTCFNAGYVGYVIDSCPIDPARPSSSADCAADEWFECISGMYDGQHVAVNCQCSPKAANADCTCIDPVYGVETAAQCTLREKLCGCAYPAILR